MQGQLLIAFGDFLLMQHQLLVEFGDIRLLLRERMNQAQQRVRKALEVLPPHTPDLFEQAPPV
ncbi:MAG: hypothetical protein EBX67_12195 [Betaproteobacteria bacterium]|nr:hypothetical protein [Betaproteobacteria bacterium]